MKIHVVIPVAPSTVQGADRVDTLATALRSVEAQTAHASHEVVVSVEVGETGPSIARNRIAASSDADVFAFLDDDDWWKPDYLDKAVAVLGDADAVISNKLGGGRDIRTNEMFATALLNGEAATPGSGLVVTRSAFEAIGGFDNDICGDDVFDFCLRLALAGKVFAYQPIPTWYRELRRSDHAGRIGVTGSQIHQRRKALASKLAHA